MKTAVRWLVNNVPLMVMALVLATLAWFVALEESDPTMERRYSQPIPVTPLEPPEGMLIVGQFDQRVQVTLRAPKSILEALKVEDFTATVDLTGLDVGTHDVPVQVTVDREPLRVVSVEPETVEVTLDSRTERTVPVRVLLEGEPALGYIRRAAIIDPREITVSGPTSYVTRVVEAFAAIDVQDATEDIETEVRPRPQDREGSSVPYVKLSPEAVDVRIPVEPSGYYRQLAVKVVLEGQVASNYRVTDISVDPPTVTVFGAPDILAALQGFIETEPIDVEGAQEDVVVRPALNVPENVAVVPGQQVEVRVFVEAIQSSVTVEVTPQVQGLDPGLQAKISPETVEVILSGPLPMLEALDDDDVRVVLDLFELAEGTHQVEPEVIVPEGLTAQSVIPATVQVEVAPMSTPAPTSRSPITATATTTSTVNETDE